MRYFPAKSAVSQPTCKGKDTKRWVSTPRGMQYPQHKKAVKDHSSVLLGREKNFQSVAFFEGLSHVESRVAQEVPDTRKTHEGVPRGTLLGVVGHRAQGGASCRMLVITSRLC